MTHTLLSWKKLPLLSELALVVLFAWMVAGWLLSQQETSHAEVIKSIEKTATILPDLNAMLAIKLFGQAAQQVKPMPSQAKVVVKAALTIKLLGTVVAGDHSAAIIAPSRGGEQRAFFIGDTILPGATLKEVKTTSIIVDRGDSLERFSLEEGKKLASQAMPDTKSIAATPTPSPPIPQARSRRQQPQHINRKMDRNHVQKQLQNLPALLSQARAMPHMVNGQMAGFTISSIMPGSFYQQAGIQSGDIITRVNGQKIINAQQVMVIYANLKNASALDIELIRAGALQNIHYDIR